MLNIIRHARISRYTVEGNTPVLFVFARVFKKSGTAESYGLSSLMRRKAICYF